jgi:hypothetical protein
MSTIRTAAQANNRTIIDDNSGSRPVTGRKSVRAAEQLTLLLGGQTSD